MKIAIVAPGPVPYTVGGAENLYESLCLYFNNETTHSCEIISLPSPERNLEEIIDSYRNFSELNLDHFDQVITLKYPTWMVLHRNHVCYMQHTLRGLYDTYHLTGLSYDVDWFGEGLGDLKKWMDNALRSSSKNNLELEAFFKDIKQILKDKKDDPLVSFPGPFAREIIHFLDSYALSPNRIKKYFAQSLTVAKRENYFPESINAPILYPAPLINGFKCEEFKYIFTASRLDSPKRIDLIIEAFKLVTHNVPLIIAGDGPQREYLEQLASEDQRIEFVGRVNEEQLVDYYANALAVVFVPYDEDYGYITIEAMKSSKPVLTTIDSGGPNEFIRDGQNGFSVDPDPESIAKKINFFCQNLDATRQMGILAAQTVEKIEWSQVVDSLVNEKITQGGHSDVPLVKQKEKMVVVVTFNIYPPLGGGQARIFNLYRSLTKYYDVEIVCLCNSNLSFRSQTICPGMTETRVPVTADFQSFEESQSKNVDWLPVTDVAAIEGYKLVNEFKLALQAAVKSADIVVASHPYLIRAIEETDTSARIWYEAHNVELDLKTTLLPNNEHSERLLKSIRDVEKDCWINSELVYACTNEDLIRLEELYGPTKALKIRAPNGVDYNSSVYLDPERKNLLKKKLGLDDQKTVLFMGSWHGPNLQAAEIYIHLASDFPDVNFLLVGSAGLAFNECKLPGNLILFGPLDDDEKAVVMCSSDVALNPMLSGSGSNLKMLDFMAFGLPIISTPFGARGFGLVPGEQYISSEIESFSVELCWFFASQDRYDKLQLSIREFVKSNYSWEIIADKFHKTLLKKLRDSPNAY